MAVENKYKGEPLPFAIERFEDTAETIPINLNNSDDVIVYVYTTPTDMKKFSRVKAGYTALTVETAYKYTGEVSGAISKTMKAGSVVLEIWTNDETKMIGKAIIYNLLECEIKAES